MSTVNAQQPTAEAVLELETSNGGGRTRPALRLRVSECTSTESERCAAFMLSPAPQPSAVQSVCACVCRCPPVLSERLTGSSTPILPRVHSLSVGQAVAEAGAPPNPAPLCCGAAVYIWRERQRIISWRLGQGLFHLCSFTFHCTVFNQPLIFTVFFV